MIPRGSYIFQEDTSTPSRRGIVRRDIFGVSMGWVTQTVNGTEMQVANRAHKSVRCLFLKAIAYQNENRSPVVDGLLEGHGPLKAMLENMGARKANVLP